MRSIGITGAYGFLGSNFISALLEKKKNGDPEWKDARIIAFASNAARLKVARAGFGELHRLASSLTDASLELDLFAGSHIETLLKEQTQW